MTEVPLRAEELHALHLRASERLLVHGERRGQALFNALHDLHPRRADAIRNTELDPFHNDDVIVDLWDYLGGTV